LIDYMSLSSIFRATGGLIVVVGLACLALGRQHGPSPEGAPNV
jgi:hypothetical protein